MTRRAANQPRGKRRRGREPVPVNDRASLRDQLQDAKRAHATTMKHTMKVTRKRDCKP